MSSSLTFCIENVKGHIIAIPRKVYYVPYIYLWLYQETSIDTISALVGNL